MMLQSSEFDQHALNVAHHVSTDLYLRTQLLNNKTIMIAKQKIESKEKMVRLGSVRFVYSLLNQYNKQLIFNLRTTQS